MVVYKVFDSPNLTLSFYRVYLCLLFDLRRMETNIFYLHILSYNSNFLLNANSFSYIACKRLHHASFKLNIVNFWRAFSFGPLNPLRGLKCTQTPNCILFSNSCRTQIFFSFLVNTLNTDCMWCFMQLGTIFTSFRMWKSPMEECYS